MYKYIYAPTKGIIGNAPTSMIPAEGAIDIKNMYIGDGEIKSDYGYKKFPAPSALASNAVLGSPMKFITFELYTRSTQFILVTTSNVYVYDTTINTWVMITKSLEISNCEAAWDAQASVVSTASSTTRIRNTYSAEHVIADAFTTGLVSSEDNLQSTDISSTTYTKLSFWVYSSIALSADDYRIRLSEQVAGGTGATYADYSVPAIAADTWTQCQVDITSPVADSGGTYPNDLNALASVSLVANVDVGAHTIYLDDIRTVHPLTGAITDRVSYGVLNNTLVFTNGVDPVYKYTGTASAGIDYLTTTLAAGSITSAKVIYVLRDHLHLCNNVENGSTVTIRDSWSSIGTIETFTGGTSGYQDLVDEPSDIMTAANLTQDIVIIYKKNSIVRATWIGGATPFSFVTLKYKLGAQGVDCVLNANGQHTVIGESFVYKYVGGQEYQQFDQQVTSILFDAMDKSYIAQSFMYYSKKHDTLCIHYSTSGSTPNRQCCYKQRYNSWYTRDRTVTALGQYKIIDTTTIGDLTGQSIGSLTWRIGDATLSSAEPTLIFGTGDGQVYYMNELLTNDNGVAINSSFTTPDFSLVHFIQESSEYDEEFTITDIGLDCAGNAVTIDYSTDGGNTWFPTQGSGTNIITIASKYTWYNQYFDSLCSKIRLRFTNNDLTSTFKFRAYRLNVFLRKRRT